LRWPPKFVLRVGGVRWMTYITRRVLTVAGEIVGGWASPRERVITVNPGREFPFMIVEEVAHALCDFLDVDDDPEEVHHLLRQLSAAVVMFMSDNQKFMRRLLDHLKGRPFEVPERLRKTKQK
jgi:hypothetical protein